MTAARNQLPAKGRVRVKAAEAAPAKDAPVPAPKRITRAMFKERATAEIVRPKFSGAFGGVLHEFADAKARQFDFDFIQVFDAAPVDRIDLIKHGVAAAILAGMAKRMGTSQESLMQTLGMPRATVARKVKENQLLSTEHSERLLGMAKLVGQVEKMVAQSGDPGGFDAARWVGDWLNQPNPALGGQLPAEYMDTSEGQGLVSKLLAQAQSGAYA